MFGVPDVLVGPLNAELSVCGSGAVKAEISLKRIGLIRSFMDSPLKGKTLNTDSKADRHELAGQIGRTLTAGGNREESTRERKG